MGTVNLPVQRERHTQWPTIPGSALKGVLRDACRERTKHQYQDDGEDVEERKRKKRRDKANEDPGLVAAFGPPSSRADEHAGALGLTDMRILAFPVRSLKGLFAWVSCPMILDRLRRDLSLFGASVPWKVAGLRRRQHRTPCRRLALPGRSGLAPRPGGVRVHQGGRVRGRCRGLAGG